MCFSLHLGFLRLLLPLSSTLPRQSFLPYNLPPPLVLAFIQGVTDAIRSENSEAAQCLGKPLCPLGPVSSSAELKSLDQKELAVFFLPKNPACYLLLCFSFVPSFPGLADSLSTCPSHLHPYPTAQSMIPATPPMSMYYISFWLLPVFPLLFLSLPKLLPAQKAK